MVFRYSKLARTFFTKYVPSRSFGGHVTWNSAVPDPNVWCCILLFLCTLAGTGMFRGPSGCSQGSSKQDARDTVKWLTRCAWWSIDHDRGARTALAEAKKFLLSAPRCCGFVTSRSQLRFVAVVGENDSLSFFFQAVTDRCAPAFGAFFYWFLVWRRRRRSAWSWRSTVGGSFFFLSSPLELPAIRLEGILLLTPNLVGLLLQYTRNPRQTGRKRKRSSTHRRSPATNKVVEILILGTYLLLDHSFRITFVLRQATVGTLLCDRMILLFSKKPSKNEENYLLIETRDRKQKKINERSWSPFDCVTSRVTQQHSRRYFQLDLTMSCRESMLQLQFPATRGTPASVPAICNHERDVKTKAHEI